MKIFIYNLNHLFPQNSHKVVEMDAIVRLDTRGRLVIPNQFRETLDLREGDRVLLSLDSKTHTLTLSPIYGKQNVLVKIEVEFNDSPGSLAKIATKLAEMKIDLIMTESKSFQRGKKARWNIIADASKCNYSLKEIKKNLLETSLVETVDIKKIDDNHLHHH